MEAKQQDQEEQQAPDVIQMTELEQVKLENSVLKLTIARDDLEKAAALRDQLCNAIGKRVGVDDVKGWFIDLKAGTMTRPAIVPEPPQAD